MVDQPLVWLELPGNRSFVLHRLVLVIILVAESSTTHDGLRWDDETRGRYWRRRREAKRREDRTKEDVIVALEHFTPICRRDVLKRMFLIIWKTLNSADKVKWARRSSR